VNAFRTLCKRYSAYVVRDCKRCVYSKSTSFNVGDKETLTKTFTKEDVETFAKISLDNNPLHTDPDFAKATKFGKCIVHGVLIHG
jgi:acyl dehydratase